MRSVVSTKVKTLQIFNKINSNFPFLFHFAMFLPISFLFSMSNCTPVPPAHLHTFKMHTCTPAHRSHLHSHSTLHKQCTLHTYHWHICTPAHRCHLHCRATRHIRIILLGHFSTAALILDIVSFCPCISSLSAPKSIMAYNWGSHQTS